MEWQTLKKEGKKGGKEKKKQKCYVSWFRKPNVMFAVRGWKKTSDSKKHVPFKVFKYINIDF